MPSVGEKRREQERARRVRAAAIVNEIAPIPPIYNVSRRIACEKNPILWLKTYLPQVFFSEFSQSQELFILESWRAILAQGSKNIEAYRGFGKTSIFSGLLLMTLLTGRVKHAYYIVAQGGRGAKQAAQWFSAALYEDYDKPTRYARPIIADYPEVCYPIQRRRGIANRPIKYHGEPCDIVITPDRLRLPTIAGSPASGATVVFASVHSPLRGASIQIRGLGSFRVGAVMFDDIQTDGNARSEKETANIVETVKSSIAFLSGKDSEGRKQPLTILSAITQNRAGDVAERIRLELPELNTVTIPFLRSTPDDFTSWRKYRDYRAGAYRRARGDTETARKALNGYYLEHRSELEQGVTVDDPRIYEPSQISAIQYALEKWADSERAFWCELQNDARRADQEQGGGLIPLTITRAIRCNPDGSQLTRYIVPDWADVLTAHIDVGEHYLNYCILASASDASAFHVVDFGTFPEQGAVVSKKRYYQDLQELYKGTKIERVTQAICDALQFVVNRPLRDPSGVSIDIAKNTEFTRHARKQGLKRVFSKFAAIGVDASDGEQGGAVWQAVADFHTLNPDLLGLAVPCYGTAANRRLVRYYPLQRGEWRRASRKIETACDWIESPESRRELARKHGAAVPAALMYDANTYKTRRDAAWRIGANGAGGLTIYAPSDELETDLVNDFALHQCAEEVTKTKRLDGLTYQEWEVRTPRVSDNEYLDTVTGALALAHWVGVEESQVKARKRVVTWE